MVELILAALLIQAGLAVANNFWTAFLIDKLRVNKKGLRTATAAGGALSLVVIFKYLGWEALELLELIGAPDIGGAPFVPPDFSLVGWGLVAVLTFGISVGVIKMGFFKNRKKATA